MTLDELYDEVLDHISSAGACMNSDIEQFLQARIAEIPGTREEVLAVIAERAPQWFRSAGAPPEWIQEADWPMLDGAPMLFLGQVDIPHSAGLFHDAAAAFVFLCPTLGETRTIIQVA